MTNEKMEAAQHTHDQDGRGAERAGGRKSGWGGRIFRLSLAIVVMGGSVVLALYWLRNRPQAERRKPPVQARLVSVQKVEPQTHEVVVQAMGTVVPATRIELAARVAGEIIAVSTEFDPGGRFQKGRRILKIDEDDYKLALRDKQSALTRALSNLEIEQGRQAVAEQEFSLLDIEVIPEDQGLVLRKPQLQSAEAEVAAARAAVEQAELNLQRTTVTAPFNALVHETRVDLGARVREGTGLATLVGTDQYWIEVLVPSDELEWLKIPGFNSEKGSAVRIYHEAAWGGDFYREGIIKRLLGSLEPEGRMARLLVAVQDPLQLDAEAAERHPLILGSYVQVKIQGRTLTETVAVPRTALHEGDEVWIMTPDDILDIRRVKRLWSTSETVYVADNIKPGERLVTSDLGSPVQGMKLRTADDTGKQREKAPGRQSQVLKPKRGTD